MNGWDMLRNGHPAEAYAFAEVAFCRNSSDVDALHLATEAALRLGRIDAALAAATKLVSTNSGANAGAQILYARSLLAVGDIPAAVSAALCAIERDATDARVLGNAGAILSACDRHAEALDMFARAVALCPNDPEHLFNLAMEQRFHGLIDAAEANCDRAISLDPDQGEAWLIRSGLRRQTREQNHIDAITTKLGTGNADWRVQAQLHYALAKELEDIEDYTESFSALALGAALRRSHTRFDVSVDIARIDAMIAGFPQRAFPGKGEAACSTDNPIFIVGMPRTGTTLVERILGAHPLVHAAGELSFFTEALIDLMRKGGFRGGDPTEMVSAARDVDPAALGSAYLSRAASFRGTEPRFVDKLPLNFLYCGLIARALPNARIIHVRRDPMDSCYAMFKTWFDSAYPFSYDLDELGRYYAAYSRLMEHWRSVIPDRILDIDYEDVVDDVEAAARRITAFCELPWSPACGKPQENSVPTTTASAAQVRHPVHRRSVGRWLKYEAQLKPLANLLAELGVMPS